ncbi:MAG: hypothetical protein QOJ71_3211, partial [Actinomycetota bacterium]|nr:hypothetical protein [Actinomycetota bacterium]
RLCRSGDAGLDFVVERSVKSDSEVGGQYGSTFDSPDELLNHLRWRLRLLA